jgi:hypothetical protein
MALPEKLYADYDKTTGEDPEGFKFVTRDPAKEMEYTAKTLAELMGTTGYWATAEKNVGTVLTERFNTSESSLYSNISTHWASKISEITTAAGGTNADTAYSQYLLGMSAAFGGGHTNIGAFIGVNSQDRRLAIIDTATKNFATLVGSTFQAVSAMPLVVPIESQLVADSCASAVEAYAMGEIRAQQIRQSAAGGEVLSQAESWISTGSGGVPPYEETLAYASVWATGAAASTK